MAISNQTVTQENYAADESRAICFLLTSTCNSNNLIEKIPSNCGAFLIDGRQTAKIYFKAASIY
jgi:hypothetical protein